MPSINPPIRSILMVCLGNICRSPAAENVMRQQLQSAGLAELIRVDSAGTHGYHIGAAPDRRMIAAGQRRGLPMTGNARQVSRADLNDFDLILAMDEDNLSELLSLSTAHNRHKLQPFARYCVTRSATHIPDPYYGGPEGFELVLDLLEDGCSELIRTLRKG